MPCCPTGSPPLLPADELAMETRITDKDDSSTSSSKIQVEIGERGERLFQFGSALLPLSQQNQESVMCCSMKVWDLYIRLNQAY